MLPDRDAPYFAHLRVREGALVNLRAWRGSLDRTRLAHVVIDEAEDFSLFELFAIGKQLDQPPRITLAGDEAQQTSSCFAGWVAAVEALGTSDAITCRLEMSYRCPRPIVELAQRILGRSRMAAR